MAENVQRFGVFVRENLKGDLSLARTRPCYVGRKLPIEIDDLPIDLSGDGCLSEALANALGHLARPGALRDLFGRSIRQTQS